MRSSSKPTLGILTWDFLQAKGGMGRSMEWMAGALSGEWRVVVGTVGDRRPETGDRGFESAPLLSWTRVFGGHVFFSFFLPFVLRRWIRKNRIDVLLIPGGPGGVFLLCKPKIPYICSVYHVYEQQARLVPGQGWKRIFRGVERRTYRGAEGILCFNADTRRVLEESYGIAPEKLTLLPHAIQTDAWKPNKEKEKVRGLCVCVARMEARKGIGVLLDAWESVLQEVPDAQLVLVGSGVLASSIDARLRKFQGTVKRVDQLPFAALVDLVQQAQVAVCPSYLEGFGLFAAEAMAAGTALVAADAEGLRCLVRDHQTGVLFPSGNSLALASTLIDLLENPKKCRDLAVHAMKDALEKYDPTTASALLRAAVKERVTSAS